MKDTIADNIKIIIIKSLNSFKNFEKFDSFLLSIILFLPSFFNLFCTSSFERPSLLEFNFFNVSSISKL